MNLKKSNYGSIHQEPQNQTGSITSGTLLNYINN